MNTNNLDTYLATTGTVVYRTSNTSSFIVATDTHKAEIRQFFEEQFKALSQELYKLWSKETTGTIRGSPEIISRTNKKERQKIHSLLVPGMGEIYKEPDLSPCYIIEPHVFKTIDGGLYLDFFGRFLKHDDPLYLNHINKPKITSIMTRPSSPKQDEKTKTFSRLERLVNCIKLTASKMFLFLVDLYDKSVSYFKKKLNKPENKKINESEQEPKFNFSDDAFLLKGKNDVEIVPFELGQTEVLIPEVTEEEQITENPNFEPQQIELEEEQVELDSDSE